jgi:hypothetical protein
MNLPEHLHERVNELLAMEADGADKRRLWAVILKAKLRRDGHRWECSYGDVKTFGKIPVDAIQKFEHAMYGGNLPS